VCAICPPIDLGLCSQALSRWQNRLYEASFLRSLKASMRRKQRLFPERYRVDGLRRVRRMWDFDDAVAPYNGFRDALDYYTRASALPLLARIQVPTLIIHAQDDPFIPFASFADPALAANAQVLLVAPAHGGHVGFWGRRRHDEDRYWAENRAIEFCALLSSLSRESEA
jgi:hypothetical protein